MKGDSDPYNYSGISNFIFSILFLLIGPTGAMISGALTYLFSRSKRSDDQVAEYISDIESKPIKPTTETTEDKTKFEAKKYCSSCGSSVPQGAKFCPICGSKI
ncbi:MAG: zinc-ribbon domain-containing protein [Candidatus Lokiarchaeota archaeon]|nr:zinc-ribbon domain-containing protein [Candidatus Lokiarchaeota archaeon]